MNGSASRASSAFGTLARRVVAWLVLAAVAVVLLKVVVGIVAGFLGTILLLALLAVLGVGVLWALRHL